MPQLSSKNSYASQITGPLTGLATYQAGVLQATANRLVKKFTDDCIAHYDLTMNQWLVIGTIYETGAIGISVTKLSRLLDTNLPYITNTLNGLEKRGIIVRQSSQLDSRSKTVQITESYRPVVQQIENNVRRELRATVYAAITPQELQTYLAVLDKLSTALSAREGAANRLS